MSAEDAVDKMLDRMRVERVNKFLNLSSDKVNALDHTLHTEFKVPRTLRKSWTRGQPYPTTMIDAMLTIKAIKAEFDEKLGLFETLNTYGVEFAISEYAHAMGVDTEAV